MLKPEPLNCLIPPSNELGGLYIGNFDGAVTIDLLKQYNIKAVLTTSIETELKYK